MNIYKEAPSNWKDLEEKTSKFLTELGYTCEVEKGTETVRGKVNVIALSKEVNPINKLTKLINDLENKASM